MSGGMSDKGDLMAQEQEQVLARVSAQGRRKWRGEEHAQMQDDALVGVTVVVGLLLFSVALALARGLLG